MTRSLHFHSKPKKKRAQPEARLQETVVEHLRMTGAPGMMYFSIPNERKCSAATLVKLCRMGMRPGAADLCIIVDGRAHFMEFKSPTGQQSLEQMKFEAWCFNTDCYYELVRDIDRARRTLIGWGALRVTGQQTRAA